MSSAIVSYASPFSASSVSARLIGNDVLKAARSAVARRWMSDNTSHDDAIVSSRRVSSVPGRGRSAPAEPRRPRSFVGGSRSARDAAIASASGLPSSRSHNSATAERGPGSIPHWRARRANNSTASSTASPATSNETAPRKTNRRRVVIKTGPSKASRKSATAPGPSASASQPSSSTPPTSRAFTARATARASISSCLRSGSTSNASATISHTSLADLAR